MLNVVTPQQEQQPDKTQLMKRRMQEIAKEFNYLVEAHCN
jgi:hypothetical protein